MPHVIACPKCAMRLQVPDDSPGKQVRCPGCQTCFPGTAGRLPAPATDRKPPVVPTLVPTLVPAAAPILLPAEPPPRTAPETKVAPDPAAALPVSVQGAKARREESIPGYEILEELGRGGMGVVYKARQIELNRLVALKMILSGLHAGTEERARFFSEAQAIARLRHPYIIQVYEVGEHDGKPFFSLEFCPGGGLDGKLAGTPLPPGPAAALVEKLARAVQLAHEYQVIHRDLKPANVLLAEDGEPRITDFGLAKRLDEVGQTRSGALMGTPSYMAPEQAAGKTHELGPAADIYALGAILYECLTGRPPFRAATVMETLLQVQCDEPVPPTQLQKKLGRDLETICLKCLQKEPARRYATAGELAEDLRRFRAGESIRARPVSRLERLTKWIKRRPAAAALVTVSVLALLALLGGAAYFTDQLRAQRNEALAEQTRAEAGEAAAEREKTRAVRGEADALRQKAEADRQRRAAEEEKAKASVQLDRARRNLFTAQLVRAAADLDREPDEALKKLHDYAACPIDLRDFAWGLFARRARRDRVTVGGHAGSVNAVAIRPDGKTLISAGSDRGIRLSDTGTGKKRPSLPRIGGNVRALTVSPDGKLLASGSDDKTIRLWDLAGVKDPITLQGPPQAVQVVVFSADGKVFASASADKTIKLWDVATGKERAQFKGPTQGAVALALSPDGKTLVVADPEYPYTLKRWDLTAIDKAPAKFAGHASIVQAVLFSPDGQTLASAASDGVIKLWDAEGKVRDTFKQDESVRALAFRPDGKFLAAAGGAQVTEGAIHLWELATKREAILLRGHRGPVTCLAFSRDGKALASGNQDATATLWDVTPGLERPVLGEHAGPVLDADFSPDGTTLATAEAGGIRFWDVATGQERPTSKDLREATNCVRFHPDGTTLFSGSADKAVRAWHVTIGKERAPFGLHKAPVLALAVSPDGKTVATGSKDGILILWDTTTDRARLILNAHVGGANETGVLAVCFSPDGRTLLSAGEDKTAKVWDASTGKERVTLKGNASWVAAFAFSPDGKTMASAGWDNKIQLWDPKTWQSGATLTGHKERVASVCFSPDGATLASGSADGTIRLWEVVTRQSRATLPAHAGGVARVVFHPGGKLLASAGEDKTVKLWDADAGPLRASLEHGHNYPEGGGLGFHPDGRTLAWATATFDEKKRRYGNALVPLWDAVTGQKFAVLCGYPGDVGALAFSPDGKKVAGVNSDGAVTLCNLGTEQKDTRTGHVSWAGAVAFSPDGKTMATAGGDRAVRLWDAAAGRQRLALKEHTEGVRALAFSSDGKLLASGSEDRTVKLWDLTAKPERELFTLEGHAGPVSSVAFSPDGKLLASAGGEYEKPGELKVWDVAARKERRALVGHTGRVLAVAFSPDGRTLAAGGSDRSKAGELKLWDVDTGAELAAFPGHRSPVHAVAFRGDGQVLATGDVYAALNLWDVPARRGRPGRE